MRVPHSEYFAHPWRIQELTRDFRVEDVWELPTPGGPDDFPLLVEQFARSGSSAEAPLATRVLFAIRFKLGELFGWDREDGGAGARVPSLRERLPPDLREGSPGPRLSTAGFKPLYLCADEFAAEIANGTMHGVLHVGWVGEGENWHGQMTILVKPNGRLGEAYMAAIKPFRYLIVYPQWLRRIERDWAAASSARRA
jgi:hypothetical protein